MPHACLHLSLCALLVWRVEEVTMTFQRFVMGVAAITTVALLPACASAQSGTAPAPVAIAEAAPDFTPAPVPNPDDFDIPAANDFCIAMMTGFPEISLEDRHQFYALIRALSHGADPQFVAAMQAYGEGEVTPDTPVVQVIEAIANPVMLQAAPQATIAQTAHLIRFGTECQVFLDGQMASLEAVNPSLADGRTRLTIGEDALYLRSLLLDAMYRLSADTDPQHGAAVAAYQRDLVTQRDGIEFAAFDAEIADIEALATGDLEERLDRANNALESGMDTENVARAADLSDMLNAAQREETQRRVSQILIDILGRSRTY